MPASSPIWRIRVLKKFAALTATLGLTSLPITAKGEPQLVLDLPSGIESVDAGTFDERGQLVGHSFFEIEALASGAQRFTIVLSVEGGGVNRSEAILVPVSDSSRTLTEHVGARDAADRFAETTAIQARSKDTIHYRIKKQRSQAKRADGVTLDLLVIDHEHGRASCYPAGQNPKAGRHTKLPADERIVIVPMQLLLRPLALGEVDEIRFQLVLCREKPVVHDMLAVRGPTRQSNGREIVEIRYGPDFGKAVAWIASRILPKFSFWFDRQTGAYLGHRMPLHTAGPNVLLVRDGLTPNDLGVEVKPN